MKHGEKRKAPTCDLFESTGGYGCFRCEKPDCDLNSSRDPLRIKALGKESKEPRNYRRWDEEIAW